MNARMMLAGLVAVFLTLHVPLAAADNPYVNQSTSNTFCPPGVFGDPALDGCAQGWIDSVVTLCGWTAGRTWKCSFHFDLYLAVTGLANCGTAKIKGVSDVIQACAIAGVPGAAETSIDYPVDFLDGENGGTWDATGILCTGLDDGESQPCFFWTHRVTYPGESQCENGNPSFGLSLSALDGGTVWVMGEPVEVPGAKDVVEEVAPGNVMQPSVSDPTGPGATRVAAYFSGPAPC